MNKFVKIKMLIEMIMDISKELKKNNASLFAASAAFYAFLSLIPVLILICSILPFINGSQEIFMDIIQEVLPQSLTGIFFGIMTEIYDKSIAILSVSAILSLWVAGKGFFALKQGLNVVNQSEEKRNVLLLRIIASLYTLVFIISILVALVVIIFGNLLNRLLIELIPGFGIIYQILLRFRFLFVWLVIAGFLQIVYTILPNKKMVFRYQFPGALFASIVWTIFTWFFSLYVDRMGGFGMYGSLTAIIIVMMWLYMGFYIILLGAFINRYLEPFCETSHFFNRRTKKNTHDNE